MRLCSESPAPIWVFIALRALSHRAGYTTGHATSLSQPFAVCRTQPQNIHKFSAHSMPSDAGASEEALVDCLTRQLIKSHFPKEDGQDFWPHGCIDAIITRDTVFHELNGASRSTSVEGRQNLDELVDFIMEKCKKTFAILVCSHLDSKQMRQVVKHFKDLGLDDSQLPIDTKSQIFGSTPPNGSYRKPWSFSKQKNFCEYQWKFLVPVFRSSQAVLKLDSLDILPFTGPNRCTGSGNFGEVHEVIIHRAHWGDIAHVRPAQSPSLHLRHRLIRLSLTVESRLRNYIAWTPTKPKPKNLRQNGRRKSMHTKQSPSSSTKTLSSS